MGLWDKLYIDDVCQRVLVGVLVYSDALEKIDRLKMHDTIASYMDTTGAQGISMNNALKTLFANFEKDGIGVGTIPDYMNPK